MPIHEVRPDEIEIVLIVGLQDGRIGGVRGLEERREAPPAIAAPGQPPLLRGVGLVPRPDVRQKNATPVCHHFLIVALERAVAGRGGINAGEFDVLSGVSRRRGGGQDEAESEREGAAAT